MHCSGPWGKKWHSSYNYRHLSQTAHILISASPLYGIMVNFIAPCASVSSFVKWGDNTGYLPHRIVGRIKWDKAWKALENIVSYQS